MQDRQGSEKIKYFFLGAAVVLGLAFLVGARDMPPQVLSNGRYQISAWGGGFGQNSGAVGVFVVDTISGETKTVYARTYGTLEKGVVLKNDLKKPFVSVK